MTAVWEGPVLFRITLGTNFRKNWEPLGSGSLKQFLSLSPSNISHRQLDSFNCYLFSPLYDFYLMTALEKKK